MNKDTLYAPLHIQISKILEEKIKSGQYTDKIPSERELMEMHSVSRTTVREAVTRLVNDGLLTKVHGKGTFVNQHVPIQEWLPSLNSFTDTVKSMGMKPGSKLIETKILSVKEHSIKVFQEDVFMIRRLRSANDEPVAIEQHFYPVHIGEKLSQFNLNEETIYDLLENELHIVLDEAEQYISTKVIDDELAPYLKIPRGTNVLLVKRIMFDENGNIIEYYIGQYRPDMYSFRLKTKRNKRNPY